MEKELTKPSKISGESLTDYSNPNSLGSRLRARRIGPLLELLRSAHERRGKVEVLDVGGRKTYWNLIPGDVLRRYRVRITILNLPDELQGESDAVFTMASGDACNLSCYPDDAFDVVHSNSVVEHVGNWTNVKRFAKEVNRLAPSFFIQTPYYWFPVEPHFLAPFFHWLPRPWRISLVMRLSLGRRGRAATLDEAIRKIEDQPILLDQRTYKLLFPDAEILKERFIFFIKSMIAYRKCRKRAAESVEANESIPDSALTMAVAPGAHSRTLSI